MMTRKHLWRPTTCRGRVAGQCRQADALRGLGCGLGEVALRVCCHLEGMESLEKRMGWSARSGKIVLRIALTQLVRHYAASEGRADDRLIATCAGRDTVLRIRVWALPFRMRYGFESMLPKQEGELRDLNIPAERHPEKARRPDTDQPRKPDWIRVKAPTAEGYKQTRDIMKRNNLVTVCEEAGCPNVGECWSQGTPR